MADVVYLDSSALVKRYIEEPGSESVEDLVAVASVCGVSEVAFVEIAAALARAARGGRIDPVAARKARRALEEDWSDFARLKLDSRTLREAADLGWGHGLRAYDAVHLASAVFWRDMLGAPVLVATYDRELWEACKRCGLGVWPEK